MAVDAKNIAGKPGASASGTRRGSNNEANYEGQAAGQQIDYETTAHMRGYYEGVWYDSPLGVPATYGQILGAAAQAGHAAGEEGLLAGVEEAGNAGQISIIERMGPQVLDNAWHYQVNGYGSARDYIEQHCAYPSALGSILDSIGDVIESVDSSDFG